jgi:hypothetical protein
MGIRQVAVMGMIVGASCGTGAVKGPLIPQIPGGIAGCRVGVSQTSVLVTEWSGAEKANLQALLSAGGAIAVTFSGCEMRIVPGCKLTGQYYWQRTTVTSDRIEIRNEAELNAKLPLGALSLGAELKKSGELAVETTVAGQARLTGIEPAMVATDPMCAQATHIVNAISMGAFTLTAGGSEGTTTNVSVSGFGGNGKLSQSAKIVRGAGQASACSGSTDTGPAQDCASPVQVFLAKIPGRGDPEGPPGTARVDFMSMDDDQRWDVFVNDQVACTTPCTQWVDPARPILMRSRTDHFLRGPERLEVSRFPPEALSAPVQVRAEAGSNGRWWGGVTCLTYGGFLGLFGGLSMTSNDDFISSAGKGMVVAGVVLVGVGAYLYLTSFPHVQVGPGFVAGKF